MLEEYLRHYVSAKQDDWAELLDSAQLAYNLQQSSATSYSPFVLATSRQRLMPLQLLDAPNKCHAASRLVERHIDMLEMTKDNLQ